MAARIRLGIDFGTSNTVAALAGVDGRIRHLVLDGSPLLASAVFAGAGSTLLVGNDAVRAASGEPAAFEGNPKRRIDDGSVWLGERDFPVVDLIAAVLGRVATEASRVAGAPPDEVVMTHPAAWGRPRLGVLALAAERAGLRGVRFVPEPVAAAAYFISVLGERVAPGRSVVIYDLGAGTFDVSVVRPTGSAIEVLAADGLADVGGLDLDAAVVAHARTFTGAESAAWERLDWPKEQADHRSRQALWLGARAVKEQLSRHSSGVLHVPLLERQLHVTRAEFEVAARPLLERTVELTHRLLGHAHSPSANAGPSIGGSSAVVSSTALAAAGPVVDPGPTSAAGPTSAVRPTGAATLPTSATDPALPIGWVMHHDATGYSIAAPGSMTPTQTGTHLLFAEPSRATFLLVDQTDQPRSDPLPDLQGKERVKNVRCGDGFDTTTYQRIAITRVAYTPTGRAPANAADWEYTCQLGGVSYHVLYRDFITGPQHAYAVIWTTTSIAWQGLRSSLDVVFASFVPADN